MSAVHQNTSSGLRSNTQRIVALTPTIYPPVVWATPFGLPVLPLV